MQHLTIILHVCNNAIDNNQRLSIGLKTGQTIHKHRITNTQLTATTNRMDVGTQLLGHQGVDTHLCRMLKIIGLATRERLSGTLINWTKSARIELCIGLFRIGTNSFLQKLVALHTHTNTAHELGDLQHIGTSLIGHGSVAMVAISLYNDTG